MTTSVFMAVPPPLTGRVRGLRALRPAATYSFADALPARVPLCFTGLLLGTLRTCRCRGIGRSSGLCPPIAMNAAAGRRQMIACRYRDRRRTVTCQDLACPDEGLRCYRLP